MKAIDTYVCSLAEAIETCTRLIDIGVNFSVVHQPEARCWIISVQEKGDKKHEGAAEA